MVIKHVKRFKANQVEEVACVTYELIFGRDTSATVKYDRTARSGRRQPKNTKGPSDPNGFINNLENKRLLQQAAHHRSG